MMQGEIVTAYWSPSREGIASMRLNRAHMSGWGVGFRMFPKWLQRLRIHDCSLLDVRRDFKFLGSRLLPRLRVVDAKSTGLDDVRVFPPTVEKLFAYGCRGLTFAGSRDALPRLRVVDAEGTGLVDVTVLPPRSRR